MSLQELRNGNVHSSLRVLWESVSVCSFLQGGRGKTVVCSSVPPGPRLCLLVRALGMQVCDGFGWFRMMLSSTIPIDLEAAGVRSLMSVLVSLEMVVEFLVVSLKTNLAHDKDKHTSTKLL